MKKVFYFALILLGLISCTKDDGGSDDNKREVAMTIVSESNLTSAKILEPAIWLRESLQKAGGPDYICKALDLVIEKAEKSGIYRTAVINYTTKDELDKDIRASAVVIYSAQKEIDKVMLVNPVTRMGKFSSPSEYSNIEMALAATGALCVFPDYIGSGASSNHCDLYLNAKVEGRTTADALLALFSYANYKNLPLTEDFKTYITGYSQGGAVTLATLRDIQTLSTSQQKSLQIARVICAGGPYDLCTTYESYVEKDKQDKTIGMGSLIPLVISSMFHSYPEEFAGYDYEKVFTEYALSTGVPQVIYQNTATFEDVALKLRDKKLSEIMDMDYLSGEGAQLQNLLITAMDRQNLCREWEPQYPLKFFHCNPDDVVTFKNLEEAYKALRNEFVEDPDVQSTIYCPAAKHIFGFPVWAWNILDGKYFD